MTVTSNTTRNDYVAGTNQNVYNYTFQLNEGSDVTVYLGGVVQTRNVHYTVQDLGVGTGGTITFTLVDSGGNPIYPTPGSAISILMTMELDRDTDYQPNGVFLASEVNNDYDRLWLATNQQQTAINRSLRLQDDDIAGASPSMELPLKDDRKGKVLAFDSVTGEPIAGIPIENEPFTLAETLAEGNTTGGNDIVYDTNDKAVFGTGAVGSALEIYTDGTGSGRIENVGLGAMVLKAPNYVFRNDSDDSILTLFQHRAASFKDNTGNTRMSVGSGKVIINDEARVYGSLRFDELATNTALDPGGSGGPIIDEIFDEDNMASDSATGLATQQSIKAYVDSQVGTVDTLSEVLANGNTTGGNDIAFGDNDKATFGANTDLEIYSDASSSFIKEFGPGGLVVQGANVNIKNSSGQRIAEFTNARSSIFYDSGGIDRLTVRSGGITVDGQARINGEVFFDSIQSNGINAVVIDDILDEDNMASDSATALATQQSIKAYVDATSGTTYTAGTGITLTGTEFSIGQSVATTDSPTFAGLTVDTNTLYVDSTNNRVGIGTSSPSAPLDVDGSGTAIDLANFGGSAQTNYSKVNFNTDALSSQAYIIAYGSGNAESGNVAIKNTNSSGDIFFTAGNAERMRIDSSGSVGIGTTAPAYSLDIRGEAGLELYNATGGGDVLNLRPSLGDANKYNMSISSYDHSGGGVGPADGISINAFDGVSVATGSSTARQERMRIDSLGNASFNTTDIAPASNNVYGTAILQYGGASMSRTNSTTLDLNRSSSDGAIIQFRKDGTSVGSIGCRASYIKIGNGDTNLLFNSAANAITPEDATANSDAVLDLGRSTSRFKDLYLSGGAYLGGTGSANKLDDYEEGAWTPVADFNGSNTGLTYSSREGHYTKIGRLVVANVRLTLSAEGTSNGTFQVSLPFVVANIASTTSLYGGGTVPWLQGYSGAAYDVAPVPFEGSSKFRLTYRSSGTASSTYMTRTNTTNNFDIRAQVIYFTT